MAQDPNPQAAYMADESMVRTLAAQAQAIWPQEEPLFRRYAVPDGGRILDAGCGTGEIALRLAERHPRASVLGVDVLDVLLAVARARAARLAPRVAFENRSVFDLGLPAGSFDLVVCRHVIHAIPEPERALAELVRVARPGGWLHLIAEDYGMIHFPPRRLDAAQFWFEAPRQFAAATGTDLHVGRRAYGLLRRLGLEALAVDYAVVDTLRVPRETFAAIWTAWRDGYAAAIGEQTRITREEAAAYFDDQLAALRDPDAYAAWMVPIVSGRVPAA
jgi:ubiquinone/menaquinone biosynthesis C-methylase UbiE